jgi:hypothetical protein
MGRWDVSIQLIGARVTTPQQSYGTPVEEKPLIKTGIDVLALNRNIVQQ